MFFVKNLYQVPVGAPWEPNVVGTGFKTEASNKSRALRRRRSYETQDLFVYSFSLLIFSAAGFARAPRFFQHKLQAMNLAIDNYGSISVNGQQLTLSDLQAMLMERAQPGSEMRILLTLSKEAPALIAEQIFELLISAMRVAWANSDHTMFVAIGTFRPPIRVGGNVRQSKLRKKVEPIYPKGAKKAGIRGAVLLQVTIDETGHVSDVKVIGGDPLLSEAAADAVRQWEYEPTILNGQPVPVIATVNFTIR